ncbi:MAG: NUDIX domain-containing protein [Anaerolineae bacterium]|nr:NUDIX domain-containing protein [Anaerolineae bacterium]
MAVLQATINQFDGVVIDPAALPSTPDLFRQALSQSLPAWIEEGHKVVWIEIPVALSSLIPVAVEAGFTFHHSSEAYLMLTLRLKQDAFIPPFATHYIGAGGVVINERQELLVVWEKAHRRNGRRYYKLPGGALHKEEHLVDGVIREVREETGILTQFEALVCFRHWHGYRYGKSDIYFVCRLSPLNHEITIQAEEIQESLWMPVQDYLEHQDVGIFNKRIVQAALSDRCLLVPTWIEGYQTEPDRREIFMPGS